MIKLRSLFRRGQGPSGSKNSSSQTTAIATTATAATATATGNHQSSGSSGGQTSSIKTSSSVSSLDRLGLKESSKTRKGHGSKDKLDQNYKNPKEKLDRGSRERIADFVLQKSDSPNIGKSKKKNSPMPIIHQHVANNNLIESRDIISNDDNVLTDLTDNSVGGGGGCGGDGGGSFDDPAALARRLSMMQDLQNHLQKLMRDKMALEATVVELSSYQTEVFQLRKEFSKLQNIQQNCSSEIQKLTDENEKLRNRLADVVNTSLSDAEKHQILQDSQRLHSSAPASIALPNLHCQDIDGGTPCMTPDGDKHSSSSEISVACLQDKIIQMEETHYSTNEELQATIQELADLQSQLSELQSHNERLSEEKDVLFQSLCRQTEKLEDSRQQIENLQELLLREPTQQDVVTTEREQKLLDLLKNAQEEREGLLIKQEEMNSELNELRQTIDKANAENLRLGELINVLNSTIDAGNAERKQIESQLFQSKEDSSQKHIEISRLTTLLENAQAKIDELEQDRAMGDKSDLGELLDTSRKEKDLLEIQIASLQEQVSKSQCEIQKLKDMLTRMTDEYKVARNNAKCALSDMEYKYETLKEEKQKLSSDFQQLQDSTNELQIQCKCHLEDKAQLEGLLSETQRHLGEAERILADKEEKLQRETKLRKQATEEWEQFQSDLLMTVRIANEYNTEAQSEKEQLITQNKSQKEKIRLLEQQIEKLNKQISSDAQQSLFNTVQEMAARRQKVGISRQDSRLSVKSLIESIESVNKQNKSSGGPGSHCSSSSSLNSVASDAINCGTNQNGTNRNTISDWSDNVIQQNQLHTPVVKVMQAKSPLREQQQTVGSNMSLNGGSQKSLITAKMSSSNSPSNSSSNATLPTASNATNATNMSYYNILQGERKDPLNALVKNGGSKRNALLKWCQNKTVGYRNIDITNFSSSWNDGLAFCAILHSYLPDRVPYDTLGPSNKRQNFTIAFSAAESVGIPTSLDINDMCQQERPDWTQVMAYVTAIYKHFEA